MQRFLCKYTFPLMYPAQRRYRLLDTESLKGLAHPLRMRMLDLLRHDGPATSSVLASRTGESTGTTSYHLRKLAAYGFVEDAPECGKGRERWWRAVPGPVGIDQDLASHSDPSVREAVDVFVGETIIGHARETAEWLETDWSEEWRLNADFSDFTLTLTPDLLDELSHRVHALVNSYRDIELAGETGGAARAERVRVHLHCFPRKRAMREGRSPDGQMVRHSPRKSGPTAPRD